MIHNRHSSPIIVSDEIESVTESDSASGAEWWAPENQLGLEPEYAFGIGWDDEVNDEVNDGVALDEKGEINHHQATAQY